MAVNENVKTEDYHLRLSGPQTMAALQKVIEADFSSLGIYTFLQSTADSPVNINGIKDPGNYYAEFVTGAGVPEEITNSTPIMISCTNVSGVLVKVACVADNRYMSWSNDNGDTWSTWVRKVDNATTFPPETDEDGNPVKSLTLEEIQAQVEQVSKLLGIVEGEVTGKGAAVFGTAAEGEAILNGTYDYDPPVIPDVPTPPEESAE